VFEGREKGTGVAAGSCKDGAGAEARVAQRSIRMQGGAEELGLREASMRRAGLRGCRLRGARLMKDEERQAEGSKAGGVRKGEERQAEEKKAAESKADGGRKAEVLEGGCSGKQRRGCGVGGHAGVSRRAAAVLEGMGEIAGLGEMRGAAGGLRLWWTSWGRLRC